MSVYLMFCSKRRMGKACYTHTMTCLTKQMRHNPEYLPKKEWNYYWGKFNTCPDLGLA